MDNDFYIELLQKQLFNELTEEEKQQLEAWLQVSDDNKQLAKDIQKALEISDSYGNHIEVDINKDFKKVQEKIKTSKEKKTSFFGSKMVFKVAASLLLLISTVFAWYWVNKSELITIVADYDNQSVVLPDSSVVILKKGTSLKYESDFLKDRKTSLLGTAFFKVRHINNEAFVVNSPTYKTEVLGTQFLVVDDNVGVPMVQLAEGKVAVTHIESLKKEILKPKEFVKIDKKNSIERLTGVETKSYQWFVSDLSFKNTELTEVIFKIEVLFNTKIEISERINKCAFTGDLSNMKLENILGNIAHLYKGDVQVNQKGYKIIGGECQ
ncbi:FecR family protein [Tenacibaculum xiamenense]|uniref:FecR family protein n=1 Tax=Tenacibaculum xiamenense TaxID=1261553 RepID=UPI0038939D7F